MNLLLHDTTDRIRQARHLETIAGHHGLIILTVTDNLVQQILTSDGLIAIDISQNPVIQSYEILAIFRQGRVPKGKRSILTNSGPHKHKRSLRLYLAHRISIDSVEQRVEPSRPISIQDSKLELEEELEQREGCHPKSKPREEAISELEPKEEANSGQEPEEEYRLDLEN